MLAYKKRVFGGQDQLKIFAPALAKKPFSWVFTVVMSLRTVAIYLSEEALDVVLFFHTSHSRISLNGFTIYTSIAWGLLSWDT